MQHHGLPAELAGLVDALLSQTESPSACWMCWAVMPKARALEGTDNAFNALEATQQAFVASANSSAALNHAIDVGDSLPDSQGAFSLRLLSLPRAVVDQIRAGRSTPAERQDAVANSESKDADDGIAQLPARSSLDLRGKDPRESLSPITATGLIQHGLLPDAGPADGTALRRDALKKTIRDALRGENNPTYRCSANLWRAWACMPPAPRCQRASAHA